MFNAFGRWYLGFKRSIESHTCPAPEPACPVCGGRLIDIRGRSERAVSQIPGTISAQDYETDPDAYTNKPVGVYCTVGGRSYLYAKKLVAAGVDARNYRDGILGWCRAAQPLETADGKPTTAIQPYWRIFHVPDQYNVGTNILDGVSA